MTGVAIGAVGGLALLALLVLGIAVRRTRPARIDSPDAAVASAERSIPGFAAVAAVVGADGIGALAVSPDNRVAVVRAVGRRVLACEIGWAGVRATAEGIVVETSDRRIGRVALAGVDILDIRRLAPASAGPSAAALASRGIAIGPRTDEFAADVRTARDG